MKRKWERETSEEGREGQPRKTENELPSYLYPDPNAKPNPKRRN